ncbi:MAG: hypothetical protein PHD97_11075, partial [Bacteroidales bacterium]|nr:hypothetical protein [Bacteroidales bacterium]
GDECMRPVVDKKKNVVIKGNEQMVHGIMESGTLFPLQEFMWQETVTVSCDWQHLIHLQVLQIQMETQEILHGTQITFMLKHQAAGKELLYLRGKI